MSPEALDETAAFKDFELRGWEKSAPAYDELMGPLTRQVVGPLLDAVKLERGMRLLDVATGPGYVAAAARRRGASVMAVDFSVQMIDLARAAHRDDGITFQVGDAEALGFEPESFDTVVMNFGILHLAQPDQAIREAHRVLRGGNAFGFTVWAKPEEAQAFALVVHAVEKFGDPEGVLPAGPPFSRFSEPSECESVLKQAGFSSTAAVKVPLVWQVRSAEELFTAFYEGTARTGGLLRAQPRDRLGPIRDEVRRQSERYRRGGAALSIPMPAWVVTATKR